jgi:transcriptional regulator with XRE-family HTH domain
MESKWNHIAARTVRDARVRAGITQRELALISGMKQPQIARIENGITQPSVPTLGRVLGSLGYGLELVTTRSENRITAVEASKNLGIACKHLMRMEPCENGSFFSTIFTR